MKANEFRIDNFVFDNSDIAKPKQISQITDIEFERVSTIVSYFPYISYDEIEPIPLTKEWLIKFGFILDGYYIKYPIYSVLKDNNNKLIYVGNFKNSGSICCEHIKYVHQLQNLYFILCGQELTIK